LAWLEPPLLALQVFFHAYAVIALLGYILTDTVITLDELFAIGAVYVLLALLWASAYALLVHYWPEAIFINPTNNPDGSVSFADLVYFSMTTLTSVGYGEITPVMPAARALAMLQHDGPLRPASLKSGWKLGSPWRSLPAGWRSRDHVPMTTT